MKRHISWKKISRTRARGPASDSLADRTDSCENKAISGASASHGAVSCSHKIARSFRHRLLIGNSLRRGYYARHRSRMNDLVPTAVALPH